LSRLAQDSAATNALFQHADRQGTGRLTVGAGAGQVSVYLMAGDVIAAESPDDQRVLLHLLRRNGVLSHGKADSLEEALDESKNVFGDLIDAAGDRLEPALAGRFRNNLATFLGSVSRPEWKQLPAVFVDNIQLGHDTRTLISDMCAVHDQANTLNVDDTVKTGVVPFETESQLSIGKALGNTERTLSSVLLDLPIEELEGRLALKHMLDVGMIVVPGTEPVLNADNNTDDSPSQSTQAADADTIIDAVRPKPDADVKSDARSEASDRHIQKLQSKGSYAPSNLDDWLEQSSVRDDDELDFFADHDHDRSTVEDGNFSTATHNLDKIEVMDMNGAPGESHPTHAKFGAPALSEDDAFGKVQVANEVLNVVVKAFDRVEGNGRGAAVVQLLVDGSPSKFAALFHNLTVGKLGTLPDVSLLHNLYARPQSEHRQLITNGLSDMIERALSSAADELPDDDFDTMYEAVAGYRQRLGR
jgi:hypothetical protein